ncbi:MAG: hypothetical protein LBS19_04095 [Clostridiales bacterium]|nr:hypothetical protein [Clostridiales bacterium]
MSIALKYIDKTAATKAALRDYDSMSVIIANTPDNLKNIYEQMASPHSSVPDGLPIAHNPKAGEDRLSSKLDTLDILRERYRAAVEYMAWFKPAWNALSDDERYILRESYMGVSYRSGSTARIMTESHFSERHVERLRSKALHRLQLLLFG